MHRSVRGSVSGLIKYHRNIKEQNTAEMLRVIARLREEKSSSLWTFKEVWSGAGLKSCVSLMSEWNSHIRLAIESHNSSIKTLINSEIASPASCLTQAEKIRELRAHIKDLKDHRNEALSKMAVYEAEIEFYKKKYEEILRLNARLQDSPKT